MFVPANDDDAVFKAFCDEASRSTGSLMHPAGASSTSVKTVELVSPSTAGSFVVVGDDQLIPALVMNSLAIDDDEFPDNNVQTRPHAMAPDAVVSHSDLMYRTAGAKLYGASPAHKHEHLHHHHHSSLVPQTPPHRLDHISAVKRNTPAEPVDLAALNIHLPPHAIIDPRAKVPLIPVSSTHPNASIEDMLHAQHDVGVVESASYLEIAGWFAARNPNVFATLQHAGRPLFIDGRAFPPSPAFDFPVESDTSTPESSHVFVGQLPVFMTQEWLHMVIEFLCNMPGSIHRVSVIPGGAGSSAPYAMIALAHEGHFQAVKSLDGRAFFCRNRVFFTRHVERKALFGTIVARIIGIDAERPSRVRDDHLARTCLVASMAFPPKRNTGSTPTAGSMAHPSASDFGRATNRRRSTHHGPLSPTASAPPPPPPYGSMITSPTSMPQQPVMPTYHFHQPPPSLPPPPPPPSSIVYVTPTPAGGYVIVPTPSMPQPAYHTHAGMPMQPVLSPHHQHQQQQQAPWLLPPRQ